METQSKTQRGHKDALQVIAILEGAHFRSMLAGGCVRDRLLGLVPNDFDIATAATPNQAMAVLKKDGCKVIPTGIDHGTITVVLKHSVVEVTTLRVDVATDGRHAQVQFSDSFEADAARRDFTINALFEDADGKIYDFFEGQQDLKRKALCFVGEPKARIEEDFLRILRLFRFWGKLDFAPETEALHAVADLAGGLRHVSQERKTAELWKLLGTHYVKKPLQKMITTGVMAEIIPNLELELPDAKQQRQLYKTKDQLRPLAWLTWLLRIPNTNDVGSDAVEKLCDDLKLANHEKSLLVGWMQQWQGLDQIGLDQVAAMTWLDGLEATSPLSDLESFILTFQGSRDSDRVKKLQNIEKVELTKGFLRRAKLPLNGSDVMQILSMEAGPDVGAFVTALRNAFREEKWATRKEGKAWLIAHRKFFSQE